jgi:RimJ/RimL family protein N-acetyltransferase
MIRVKPDQVTPKIRSLFAADDPAKVRCISVLEGTLPGDILVDDLMNPTWGVVRGAGGGTTFLSHKIPSDVGHRVIRTLREAGNIVVGMWENDSRWAELPSESAQDGINIEFLDRARDQNLEAYLQAKSPDWHILPIDSVLFPRCAWYSVVCREYGTAEGFLQKGLGFCLVGTDEILAEVYLTPAVDGTREIGVRTHDAYRGQGYGTLLSAYGIKVCEGLGDRVYWNTARQNLASLAIARKLGFQRERAYPVRIWRTPNVERF